MGDPLKKVLPGQELSIPADAYNAFIDAAIRESEKLHRRRGELTVRRQTVYS